MKVHAETSPAFHHSNGDIPHANGSIKDKTVLILTGAHLDTWTWKKRETKVQNITTFRSAKNVLRDVPEATFEATQTEHYEFIEDEDPETFTQIQALVAGGRWELTGGTITEQCCTIPNGESHARQYLYGQRYFAEKFSQTAEVAQHTDSFGQDDITQIEAESDILYEADFRPEKMDKALAPLVVRVGPNGSRIIRSRIVRNYNASSEALETHIRIGAADMAPLFDIWLQKDGIGNHGGIEGKILFKTISQLHEDPTLPTIRPGTWKEFFESLPEELRESLQEVYGPIGYHAPGVWSNGLELHRLNRLNEALLPAAEIAAVMAHQGIGRDYPQRKLTEAWVEKVLPNQFHDIIDVTVLKETLDTTVIPDMMAGISTAQNELDDALVAQVAYMDVPQHANGIPVIGFNTLSWDRAGMIEAELPFNNPTDAFHVTDLNGKELPSQKIMSGANVPWQGRILFRADDIPSVGWNTFHIVRNEGKNLYEDLKTTETSISNGRYELRVDPETGGLTLMESQYEVPLFRGFGGILSMYDDPTDTWGHGVMRFDEKLLGQFTPSVEKGEPAIKLVESGPVRSTLRVTGRFEDSIVKQYISMNSLDDRIDIHYELDMRAQLQALRTNFPTIFTHSGAIIEGPYSLFGYDQSTPREVPLKRWLDISGELQTKDDLIPYGVTVATDAVGSGNIIGPASGRANIGVTLARFPEYAHHHPGPHNPDARHYINEGRSECTVSLIPHKDTWRTSLPFRRAAELAMPLQEVVYNSQNLDLDPDKTLPPRASLLRVDSDTNGVTVPVLKLAEDGSGDLIARAKNELDMKTTTKFDFPHWYGGRSITAELTPEELATLRIPKDPAQPIYETNITELQGPPDAAADSSANGHVNDAELKYVN
jgi:alpha-mannosidase